MNRTYKSGDDRFAHKGISVRVTRDQCDPDWDRFVAQCPDGHHEQTSLWGQVKACYGWNPLRIVVGTAGGILAGVQILIRRIGRWGRIGYVTRGPISISNDPELVELVLMQLHRVAERERFIYLVVVPPYRGHMSLSFLERLGFLEKPEVLPPGGVMTATLLLDLSDDLEILMARMRKKTRQHIRGAVRNDIVVREGAADDVDMFRQLMWALCKRRGTSPTPPQKDFFENLWGVFHPAGFVKLFVAELAGVPISANLVFPFGDAVRSWKIGWAGDHTELRPNELLYWEVIRWSKRNGYRIFDFVWIETELAKALERTHPVDWNSVDGMSYFKLGFGGTPLVLPNPRYRFYHPLLRGFAKVGGSRLLESQTVARLAGRLWGRMAVRGEG